MQYRLLGLLSAIQSVLQQQIKDEVKIEVSIQEITRIASIHHHYHLYITCKTCEFTHHCKESKIPNGDAN